MRDLRRCLEHLDDAIAAATALGLGTEDAKRIGETARSRLAYVSDAYVLAIAGGTGVGKSTLLNAIAGEDVSAAGVRRPTTSEPVAWIPAGQRAGLASLLDWLGIGTAREHRAGDLDDVAIIDLPDIDSVQAEHRARVDALLPRVDAVVWVVDPEKYKDDLLHASYLRTWAPRLRRQLVVLNRSDLLGAQDAARVRDDLRDELRREGLDGIDVAVTRAREGAAGVGELRAWLDVDVEAKRVIAGRIAAESRHAIGVLAARAGVSDGAPAHLVEPARLERALEATTRGVLAVVDVAGLGRQAVAATRLAARPRGGGPLGHLTSALYRLTGRARAAADPAGYLRRWRLRGSLAPAVEPLRELVASALPGAPAGLRASLAALSVPGALEARLSDAVDRAIAAEAADFRVPTSALWSVIGFMQYAVTGALIFAALWFAGLFVIDDVPTGVIVLPYLGAVPTPVVLLAGALFAGYLLATALRLHAGWSGRRWARRIADAVTGEVRQHVRDSQLLPLETLESARAALARIARESANDCSGT